MTQMTHRLYTNEYNEKFVKQLRHNKIEGISCTDESTDNVLVLCGELDTLQRLASLMYAEEAAIKAEFPSFLTKEDRDAECDKLFRETKHELQEALLNILNKYEKTGVYLCANSNYRRVFNAYEELVEL